MQDDVADEMPDLIPLATRFNDRAALADTLLPFKPRTGWAGPIIGGGRQRFISLRRSIRRNIPPPITILTALLPGFPLSGMGC